MRALAGGAGGAIGYGIGQGLTKIGNSFNGGSLADDLDGVGSGCYSINDTKSVDILYGYLKASAQCNLDIDHLSNKLDNINSHLTDMDIQGAQRDLAGNPVPKPGGGYYDHLQEVNDAKTGLRKIITSIQSELQNNPNLTDDEALKLQSILSDSSKKLDYVESLVP